MPPSIRVGLAATAAALALLAGCKSIEGETPVLIPNKALALSRSLSIPLDALVLAAGAVVIVDPLAPNWQIEQQDLGAGRYAFALAKKRFASGGDGEAMPVLRRRIDQLAREKGYAGYELLEYSEGIDSKLPVSQRVLRGVVQFAAAPTGGTSAAARER
jgi:hypothetical protein